jgi:hypothetical protein
MPWPAHGAHLLIKGFEILPTDIGRLLRIGDVELEIARQHVLCAGLKGQAHDPDEALRPGWHGLPNRAQGQYSGWRQCRNPGLNVRQPS